MTTTMRLTISGGVMAESTWETHTHQKNLFLCSVLIIHQCFSRFVTLQSNTVSGWRDSSSAGNVRMKMCDFCMCSRLVLLSFDCVAWMCYLAHYRSICSQKAFNGSRQSFLNLNPNTHQAPSTSGAISIGWQSTLRWYSLVRKKEAANWNDWNGIVLSHLHKRRHLPGLTGRLKWSFTLGLLFKGIFTENEGNRRTDVFVLGSRIIHRLLTTLQVLVFVTSALDSSQHLTNIRSKKEKKKFAVLTDTLSSSCRRWHSDI